MPICNFKQWLNQQSKTLSEDGLGGSDPTDSFRFNPKDQPMQDSAEDYEKLRDEVTKLAFSKYNSRVMDFLRTLGEENSDRELMMLVEKLQSGSNSGLMRRDWKPRNAGGNNEIVPPAADKGMDPNAAD